MTAENPMAEIKRPEVDRKEQAVRYKLAFDRYINEKGYKDIHALVAFSGTVHDPEAHTQELYCNLIDVFVTVKHC